MFVSTSAFISLGFDYFTNNMTMLNNGPTSMQYLPPPLRATACGVDPRCYGQQQQQQRGQKQQ
jgi:hypothetical protein